MNDHELTREEATYYINSLSRRNYENHDEHMKICKGLFDTDAALRAERDEYKRKYELVINDAAYGECCEIRAKAEKERDALKEQVAGVTQNYESAIHGRIQFRTALGVEREAKDVLLKQVADLTCRLKEEAHLATERFHRIQYLERQVVDLTQQLADRDLKIKSLLEAMQSVRTTKEVAK